MQKKIFSCFLFIILTGVSIFTSSASGEKRPELYLEVEILKVKEVFRVLDTYAGEIWPGWNNYRDVEVYVYFPNQVQILINPRAEVPGGFTALESQTVNGKPVYIDRQKEIPMVMELPFHGGGKGGTTISVRLSGSKIPPESMEKIKKWRAGEIKDLESDTSLSYASEEMILLYVHEFFHGMQTLFKYKEDEEKNRLFMDYSPNAEYAAYNAIEGMALLKALEEKDSERAIEYFKDYAAAHELKKPFIPNDALAGEEMVTTSEGTATYSNIKTAILIRDRKYKPAISSDIDPFFFNFQFMETYIRMSLYEDIKALTEYPAVPLARCYEYGAAIGLLLDRFHPTWKQNFFQEKKSLDSVVAQFMPFPKDLAKALVEKLHSQYDYNRLYTTFKKTFDERDEAFKLIESRKGKKYILDFSHIRDLIHLIPRGKLISLKAGRSIYPNGIKDFQLADIEWTMGDSPLHRLSPRSYEWIDTESTPAEKGFVLNYKETTGDIYKDAEIKTRGFTFKAPGIRLIENTDKNEVQIIVMSKARKPSR